MPRERQNLRAVDLTSAALVRSTKTGRIYRLGPPTKRNSNMNVVNHCQLYARNGRLASEKWYSLHKLQRLGFKLHTVPVGQLSLTKA
ncbi:hypothetical protein HHL22_20680 [Hymenobacter sp. RP-2-7]|uniref:Uncharacterized protein n=1 Tax=Hymenobacter polaris TaxID=2682546 RepID=A0A7Y0AHS6_9BACT|nr:hypothetical protein [Hymenobacter polaris]NML67624.1 hypothetical protein [Hymenobacter polaris]